MVERITIRPGKVRGLGNIISERSITDFSVYMSEITSANAEVNGVTRTVYSMGSNDDDVYVGVSVSKPSIELGETVSFIAHVTVAEEEVEGEIVYFKVNNVIVGSATTNSQGDATLSDYQPTVSGNLSITATFNNHTSSATTLVVNDTSQYHLTINASTIYLGENVNLFATLLNTNNEGVSGKSVSFYAKAPGGSDTLIGTATTNNNGVATLNTYTPNTYGIWEFYACFAELGSRISIRVKQVIDHIVLTAVDNPSWNTNESWSATLYDSSNNVIIDARTVELYIDNVLYNTFNSNSSGVANGTYRIDPEVYNQEGPTWQTSLKAVSENVTSNIVTLNVQSTGLIEYGVGNLGQFSIENGYLKVTFTDDVEYCSYSLENGYLKVTTDLPERCFSIRNGVLYCTPP